MRGVSAAVLLSTTALFLVFASRDEDAKTVVEVSSGSHFVSKANASGALLTDIKQHQKLTQEVQAPEISDCRCRPFEMASSGNPCLLKEGEVYEGCDERVARDGRLAAEQEVAALKEAAESDDSQDVEESVGTAVGREEDAEAFDDRRKRRMDKRRAAHARHENRKGRAELERKVKEQEQQIAEWKRKYHRAEAYETGTGDEDEEVERLKLKSEVSDLKLKLSQMNEAKAERQSEEDQAHIKDLESQLNALQAHVAIPTAQVAGATTAQLDSSIEQAKQREKMATQQAGVYNAEAELAERRRVFAEEQSRLPPAQGAPLQRAAGMQGVPPLPMAQAIPVVPSLPNGGIPVPPS